MSQEISNQSASDLKTAPKLTQRDAKEFKALSTPRSEIGGSSQDIQYCEELKSGNRWIAKCSYNAMATPQALADLSQQVRKPLTPYFEEYKEWLGLACYQLFGVMTPEIALGEFLPAKARHQDRVDGLNYGTPCLHVFSKFVPGFQEYGKGIGQDFLARYREWAQTKKGYFQFQICGTEKTVPLKRFGAMLAVACFIYDLDCLGNSLGNAGFRIQTDASDEYAETIKIDPGFAFSFLDESSKHDARDRTIQFGTLKQGNRDPLISFLELTVPDQVEFAQTARKILQVSKAEFKALTDQVVTRKGFTQKQADELLIGLLARKSMFLNGFPTEVSRQIQDEVRVARKAVIAGLLSKQGHLPAPSINTADNKHRASGAMVIVPDSKQSKPIQASSSITTRGPVSDENEYESPSETKQTPTPVDFPNISSSSSLSVSSGKAGETKSITKISPLLAWGDESDELLLGIKQSSIHRSPSNFEAQLLAQQADVESKAIELTARLASEKQKGAKLEEKISCKVFQEPAVNAWFIGRENILANIAKQLHTSHGSVITQGISGLGGVGKTQIAARYAQLASEGASCGGERLQYQAVIWLNAEYHLDIQFLMLAEAWLNKTGLKPEEAVTMVYRYLQNKRTLLVFDNAVDKESIAPFLPPSKLPAIDRFRTAFSSNSLHILITSRNSQWQAVSTLNVNGFSPEEAAAFVQKRLPTATSEEINTLIETVSTLPLALSHAVAYIAEGHSTLQDYPRQFALHQLSLGGATTQTDASHTVLTTFLLTLFRLKQEHPVVVPILQTCAYLASENIPVAWLETALAGPETAKGGYSLGRFSLPEVRSGLSALQRHALLQSEKTGFLNIHRLLQQVICYQLKTANTGQDQIKQVLNLLADVCPREEGSHVGDQALLAFLPHIEAVTEEYQKYGVDDPKLAVALEQVGATYQYVLGQPAKSRVAYEHALDHHMPPIRAVNTLIGLGNAYGELGNVHKKRDLLEQALQIKEVNYEENPDLFAMILMNLGAAYGSLGDIAKQRDLLEIVLKIQEPHYGKNHYEIAKTLTSLGSAYRTLGDVNKSIQLLERALKIKESYYGENHGEVALTLVNLGNAYAELGDVLKQRGLLERALKIYELFYGKNYYEIGLVLMNLGNTYASKDFVKMRDLLECALKIQEPHYGEDHYQVALTLINLGNAYGALGDVHKKRDLLERALKIYELHYGKNNFQLTSVLTNLVVAYYDLKQPQVAIQAAHRTYQIFIHQSDYSVEHPKIMQSLGLFVSYCGFSLDELKSGRLLAEEKRIPKPGVTSSESKNMKGKNSNAFAKDLKANQLKLNERIELKLSSNSLAHRYFIDLAEVIGKPLIELGESISSTSNLHAIFLSIHWLREVYRANPSGFREVCLQLNVQEGTLLTQIGLKDNASPVDVAVHLRPTTPQQLIMDDALCEAPVEESKQRRLDSKQEAMLPQPLMPSSNAQLLSQQGLASNGVQQAQQQLGQSVLALLAAINNQRKPSWNAKTHISVTATVVNAIAEGKTSFQELCAKPEKQSIPAELAGFIQSYVAQHRELHELSTYPDFARRLKDDLIAGKLDELHTRFGVQKPEQKAVAGGSNKESSKCTINTAML